MWGEQSKREPTQWRRFTAEALLHVTTMTFLLLTPEKVVIKTIHHY
jgi:hypothetical protein